MMLYEWNSEELDETLFVVCETPQEAIDLIKKHLKDRYDIEEDVEVVSHDTYTVMEGRDLI